MDESDSLGRVDLRRVLIGVRRARSLDQAQKYFLRQLESAGLVEDLQPKAFSGPTVSLKEWWSDTKGTLPYEVAGLSGTPEKTIALSILSIEEEINYYDKTGRVVTPTTNEIREFLLDEFSVYYEDFSPGGCQYECSPEDVDCESEEERMAHCKDRREWAESVINRLADYPISELRDTSKPVLTGSLRIVRG